MGTFVFTGLALTTFPGPSSLHGAFRGLGTEDRTLPDTSGVERGLEMLLTGLDAGEGCPLTNFVSGTSVFCGLGGITLDDLTGE